MMSKSTYELEKEKVKFIIPKPEKLNMSMPFARSSSGVRIKNPIIAQSLGQVRDPIDVLKKIGLRDAGEKYVPTVSQSVRSNEQVKPEGNFTILKNFPAIIASFESENDEAQAKHELRQDYEFVPNFALSLPKRVAANVTMSQSRRFRTSVHPHDHTWPQDSGIQEARRNQIRGNGVMIGVLDSGVDAGHRQFHGKTIPFRYVSPIDRGYDREIYGFDTTSHGTHVSGILTGQTIGIAPDADLYMASVLESESIGTSMDRVFKGIDWLINKFIQKGTQSPAIINMSLGFQEDYNFTNPQEVTDHNNRLSLLNTMIDILCKLNILVVAAVGNNPDPQLNSSYFTHPAASENVLAVGAVDFNLNVAPFSGRGNPTPTVCKPDVVGYGVDVLSSIERDWHNESWYDGCCGTSMASPYVAGIAALYWGQNPSLTAREVWEMVISNALPISSAPGCVGSGLARYVF